MNARGVHYDIKTKLNKLDSNQYRNLKVPEIDWRVNEALDIYIKNVAEPRVKNNIGFEANQRNIDSLRTLVTSTITTPSKLNDRVWLSSLPSDYTFHISSNATLGKNQCVHSNVRTTIVEHDDKFNEVFYISSFEWRVLNILFEEGGIKIHTDGTFNINNFELFYIKEHPYFHNAQDYTNGTYTMPDGTILTGSQDIILPDIVHREIVDLAVLLITGDIDNPNLQAKQNRINLNKIIN